MDDMMKNDSSSSDTPKELGPPPGLSLDMQVAVEVLGWQRLEPNKWRHPQHGDGYTSIPSYSTFLLAAWKVLESFEGPKKMEWLPEAEVWLCVIGDVCQVDKKAARAICLAALRVKGCKG